MIITADLRICQVVTKFLDQPVVKIARAYLDTPFHHQGRVNSGLDCIGLIVVAYREAGYFIDDYVQYRKQPNELEFISYVEKNAYKITLEEALDGDMALFYIKKKVQHAGILASGCTHIIHTWSQVSRDNHEQGKVVENTLAGPWLQRLHSVWRVEPWRLLH